MNAKFTVAWATIIIALFCSSALAQEVDWLQRIDEAMNKPEDSHAMVTMTLKDKNGGLISKKMEMWNRGEKRFIRFKEPADVKCVGFLVLSNDDMSIYMPSFGKIRRIASHVKNQSFMGSDFSYEDMETSSFSTNYSAKIIKQDKEFVILELTRKEGADTHFKKLEIRVRKADAMPVLIRYFKNGKAVKERRILQSKVEKGIPIPTVMETTDLENNHKTRMEMKDIKINIGIRNKIFSKRKLLRCK